MLKRLLAFSVALSLLLPLPAQAFFSPILAGQGRQIAQDIFEAKQKNGAGDFYLAYRKAFAEDKQRQKNKEATGTSPWFNVLWSQSQPSLLGGLYTGVESLFLLFNYLISGNADILGGWLPGEFVSSCLRNEIWEAQQMMDDALNEALKAAILFDVALAQKLWNDYLYMKTAVSLLRNDHKSPTAALTFFGEADPAKNLYVTCPYGEFTQAFKKVAQSGEALWQTLQSVSQISGGLMDTIAAFSPDACTKIGNDNACQIRRRAQKDANDWFAKNQVSLTLRGEKGGSSVSLVTLVAQEGAAGLVNGLRQQFKFALVDLVAQAMTAYDKQQTDFAKRQEPEFLELLGQVGLRKVFQANLESDVLQNMQQYTSFVRVSDAAVNDLSGAGAALVQEVRRGAGDADPKVSGSIHDLCLTLLAVVKKQCTNKSQGVFQSISEVFKGTPDCE